MEQEEDNVRYHYIIWCQECGTAGLDSLQCCDNEKSEIGWTECVDE